MATVPMFPDQPTAELMRRFEEFATPLIQQGQFADNAAVLTAARADLLRERIYDEESLERALEDGFTSGTAGKDVFGRLRERHGLLPRAS